MEKEKNKGIFLIFSMSRMLWNEKILQTKQVKKPRLNEKEIASSNIFLRNLFNDHIILALKKTNYY
jgi:hypothetical protein